MKVVLDANLFVSSVLTPEGAPGQVLRGWRRGAFDLITSTALLAGIGRVLAYRHLIARHRLDTTEREDFTRDIATRAACVDTTEVISICRDESDNRVLEAAAAGAVDYIVTGDRDLLVLGEFRAIQILTARQFLDLLTAQAG